MPICAANGNGRSSIGRRRRRSRIFWPPAKPVEGPRVDAFDRRIVSLLAFGPGLTLFVFSLITGRDTNAMWGFPLWLFIGLWIVIFAPAMVDGVRLGRLAAIWAVVFVIFAATFIADYLVLPHYDHRYRAAFFPGDRLSQAITQRFQQATGQLEKPVRRRDVRRMIARAHTVLREKSKKPV